MARKIAKRLHILNRGREPFLTYLRNITPQVLLIYAALMLSTKMDFGRLDLSNWVMTVECFILFGAFAAAFGINASNLLRSFSSRFERWRRRVGALLDRNGITDRRRRNAVKLGEGIKRLHVEFVEYMLVVILMQMVLAVVFFSALQQVATTRITHMT